MTKHLYIAKEWVKSALGFVYYKSGYGIVIDPVYKSLIAINLAHLVVCCRAVTLPYNIPGISRLVLTRDAVVGIYNGTINRWNDPELRSTNPDQPLPAERIHAGDLQV